MAKIADLTDDQRSALTAYDGFLRALFADQGRVYKNVNPNEWAAFAETYISALIPTIDAGEVMPTQTTFANARPLTRDEFVRLAGIAEGLRALMTDPANFAAYVAAVGTNAY